MWQVISVSFFRAFLAYTLLVIVLRMVVRRAVSQLTVTDLAVAISLGSVTANLAIGDNRSPLAVGTILVTLGLLELMTGFLATKSRSLRKLINSEPIAVIENGRINKGNMARTRLTLDKLMSMLRDKNVFNVADVEFALFETDGKISVQLKSQKKPVTPSDLDVPTRYTGLVTDLIMDGTIFHDKLSEVNLDERWLIERLMDQGIDSPRKVFYAGLDSQGSLYVSRKPDT